MIVTDTHPATLTEDGAFQSRPDLTYAASPFAYQRRRTHVVMVGDVGVGGANPIRVQSMTTTRTLDTDATVAQAERLVQAGCEIVRITAPTAKDARNLGEIKRRLRAKGVTVPLVADIHFSPDAAIEAAEHVEKVRINPGNYVDGRKFAVRSYTDAQYEAELARIAERFAPLVLKCKAKKIAMRIGTNHGSLSDRVVNRFGDTPEGMVESALEFVHICERYDYYDVILSMKASNPKVMIAAYRLLAARMGELGMTYPFHLGVTEAGNGIDGRIKSAIGIGSLLADGIGDTIRVSLTEEPEEEVPVAFRIANYFTPREIAVAQILSPLPTGEGVGEGRSPFSKLSSTLTAGYDPHPNPLPEGEGNGPANPFPEGEGTDAPHQGWGAPWDPFHYERRATHPVRLGQVELGGENVVAVVARIGSDAEARLLRWASPGNRRLPRPDIVEWPVPDRVAIGTLRAARCHLDEARALAGLIPSVAPKLPVVALLASGHDPSLLVDALPFVDGVLLQLTDENTATTLAKATGSSGKSFWIEARVPDATTEGIDRAVSRLLAAREASSPAGSDKVVLAVTADGAEAAIHAQRRLASRLASVGATNPLFIRTLPNGDRLIHAAIAPGSLLCDGVGDAVQAATPEAGQDETQLTLDVLQGSGTRLSKTDYVACPSCGRTLFDLQSTTERIKAQTAHLAGVKIAIMGCVVNGPGEMADADFGYVGGSPGHVNLYVGKTCIERNVPAEIADTKLIELIKAKGRWHEPEPDEAGLG